jgi:hypothetical protein
MRSDTRTSLIVMPQRFESVMETLVRLTSANVASERFIVVNDERCRATFTKLEFSSFASEKSDSAVDTPMGETAKERQVGGFLFTEYDVGKVTIGL